MDSLKSLFFPLARHALTTAAGAIGIDAYASGDEQQAIISGILAGVGLLWSFAQARINARKLKAAGAA
jgi:hypothetical protein